jgi:hypothetical protein
VAIDEFFRGDDHARQRCSVAQFPLAQISARFVAVVENLILMHGQHIDRAIEAISRTPPEIPQRA